MGKTVRVIRYGKFRPSRAQRGGRTGKDSLHKTMARRLTYLRWLRILIDATFVRHGLKPVAFFTWLFAYTWYCRDFACSCFESLWAGTVDLRTFMSAWTRTCAWFEQGVYPADYLLKRSSFDDLDPTSTRLWSDLDSLTQYANILGAERFVQLLLQRPYTFGKCLVGSTRLV